MLLRSALLLSSLVFAGCSSSTANNGPKPPSSHKVEAQGLPEPTPVKVNPVAISKVVKGLNRLSIELYKRTDKEGNMVASPLSVATALSVIELGARDESAQALQALFGADRKTHKLGLQGLLQQLRGGGTKVTSHYGEELYPHEFSVSSSLWTDKTFPLSKRYRRSIASSYRAFASQVDVGKPEDAAAKVNQWVSKASAGKIKTMTDASAFSEASRLALLNVAYFRGSWRTPFASVAPAPFHANGQEETSEVNTMTVFDYASSVQNEEVKIVDLKYASASKSVGLTMTVLLPRKRQGLAELESGLTLEKLQGWLAEMRGGAVHIELPMWQTSSALDFKAALTELGIGELFGLEANLSGISKTAGLHIGAVKHEAYIEVDRKGTEAAGVTYVPQPCGEPLGDGEFHADHPFLYLIRDAKSGAILFIGRVVDPGR